MAYLQAKGRVELANSLIPVETMLANDRLEFRVGFHNRNSENGIQGEIEFSENAKFMLVRGREIYRFRDNEKFTMLARIGIILFLSITFIANNIGTTQSLVCLTSLLLFGFVMILIFAGQARRCHNLTTLLQNVLTEPDESKL